MTRRLGRSGVAKIVTDSKPILGPDYRKLPVLVSITFVMGLIEAILLLLIVQMAVALAAGKDHFDVGLGPISLTDISLYSGVMAGVVLVTSLVGLLIPVARMTGRLAAQAQYRTRERIVASYLRARWDVRSKYPEGHLQELVTTFTQRTEHAVNQLVNASTALCGLAAIMLTAFVSSPVVAAGAVVCVAGLGGLLRPIMKLTRTASSEFAVSNRDFASRMAEIGRITPEITTFDVAQRVETSIDGHAVQVAGQLRRIRMLSRLSSSLYQYAALLLIVVAIGAVVALADRDGLATMGTVLLLLIRALAYGQQLQTQVQASNETAPFLKMVEDEIASLSSAQVSRGGTRIGGPTPLRFDNVWFAYEPHQHVIRGITFEVAHGESIGIVGRSGAGKSTLIQLLLRLHTPTGGTILADGVALDSVALSLWYEMVAYVPQDNKLISGTVAENIRFFRPYLPDASVHDAARRAHLHDDILGLPDGYDTRIGMGVRELSGGQRQRLGIARALAGDPQLLILDEPTSALDARSETLVSETLHKLRGTVTTIIITHRPATTAYCDRILRIDAGQVSVEKPSSSGLVAHASPSAQEAHP